MKHISLVIYGLWLGVIFIGLMILGEGLFPNSLSGTAFTDMGILSVFALVIADSLFTVGSARE